MILPAIRIITIALLAALAVIMGVMVVYAYKRQKEKYLRRLKENKANAVPLFMLALGVGAAILYGGSKSSVIIFDDYIQNAGSYVTNDYVHVAFTVRSASIPSSTPVVVWYRDRLLTNDTDWVEYQPQYTIADYPRDLPMASATNFDWCVWLDFSAPPSVHTNGVWELKGFTIPGGATFNNTKLETKQ